MSVLKTIAFALIVALPLVVLAFYIPFWLYTLCAISHIVSVCISYFLGISQVRSWKRANNKYWHKFLKEEEGKTMIIGQGSIVKRFYNDEYNSTYIVLETQICENHHNMALYPIHLDGIDIEKRNYGLASIDWHTLKPHEDWYPFNFRVQDHNMKLVKVEGVKP